MQLASDRVTHAAGRLGPAQTTPVTADAGSGHRAPVRRICSIVSLTLLPESEMGDELYYPGPTKGGSISRRWPISSRQVVGWPMQATMTAQLVTDALVMAIWQQRQLLAVLHNSGKDQPIYQQAVPTALGGTRPGICAEYRGAARTARRTVSGSLH